MKLKEVHMKRWMPALLGILVGVACMTVQASQTNLSVSVFNPQMPRYDLLILGSVDTISVNHGWVVTDYSPYKSCDALVKATGMYFELMVSPSVKVKGPHYSSVYNEASGTWRCMWEYTIKVKDLPPGGYTLTGVWTDRNGVQTTFFPTYLSVHEPFDPPKE